VHRTGRTGRAGRAGKAASFVLPDQRNEMRQIAVELGLHQEFDSAPGAKNGHPTNGQRQNGNSHRNGNRQHGNRNGNRPNGNRGGNRRRRSRSGRR
jgi:ATP-dependent RNA helicase DeaD